MAGFLVVPAVYAIIASSFTLLDVFLLKSLGIEILNNATATVTINDS